MAKSKNQNLHVAKAAKKDEFYTRMEDICAELKHYKEHFRDKVVFCNCDDPYESNFFKYFALNFNALGLKKLICTCYGTKKDNQLELDFDDTKSRSSEISERVAYKIVLSEVKDLNGDGAEDLEDVQIFLKKNPPEILKGNGDFRSEECIELLKEADMVVTNPPFSLFREYVAQLVKYEKKFLILGNKNTIACKEIFPLIKENKLWTGYRGFSGGMWFSAEYEGKTEKYVDGKKLINVPTIWYTNLDHDKRHEPLDLYKHYTPEDYPKYDNYDAINVDKVAEIPMDYDGIMGVPITFLDKYCPEQFEILGCTQRGCHDKVPDTKKYNDYWEVRQNGERTGSSGNKTNENANLAGNDGKKNFFIDKEGHIIQSTFSRIFIRKIKQKERTVSDTPYN